MSPRDLFAGWVAAVMLTLALPTLAFALPVPLSQFGSIGSGAGQLDTPTDVAIDGAGRVYVADSNNNRISVFSAGGTFIHAFGQDVALPDGGTAFEVCPTQGACQAGDNLGDAGALQGPYGVALDGAGRLYVADLGNSRISVFNTAGPSFVHAFGLDVADPDGGTTFEVCPAQGACREGDSGGGGVAGELSSPSGVAVDGAGNLYVVDSYHRVSVFNTVGPTFTHAFGWDVAVGGGTMFQVCPTQGACKVGVLGGGAGQLRFPNAVDLDGAGGIYVADTGNERISVFNAAGPSFTRAFGADVAEPADAGTPFEVCPIQGACRMGESAATDGALADALGIAFDGAGGLHVADQDNHRISQYGTAGIFTRAFGFDVALPAETMTLAFEVCPTQGACKIGDLGNGFGQFNGPQGVGADCRGAAWVADSNNNRVQRIGEPGTPLPPSCPVTTASPPGGTAASPIAPTTNPACAAIRAKLKKAKSKKRKKKLRKKLRKLGC